MAETSIVTVALNPVNPDQVPNPFNPADFLSSTNYYNQGSNLSVVNAIPITSLYSPVTTNAVIQDAVTPNPNPPPQTSNTPVAQSSSNSQTLYSINSKSLNTDSVRISDGEPTNADMYKVPVPEGLPTFEVSNTLQKYDGVPLFLEMVDSTGSKQGVSFQDFFISTLKLTPNPDTLTINSGKKVNRYHTLVGWVEEHWGDDIDTISLSGSTFSFFTLENGLTYEFRDQTAAYTFLKELIYYYQVNGCIYQGSNDYESADSLSVKEFLYNNPEFVNHHPRTGMMKERLYLKMYYDYLVLYGRFETFDIIEDASVPFRFKYNIIFKAERTIYNLDILA